ncbi:MAG: hypothetical protein AAGJ46_04015 [Planctomycetota bacterium]
MIPLNLQRSLTAALITFALAGPGVAKTHLLKHDDGEQDSKRSISGAGHAVRFECPGEGPWRLTGIRLHASRYGTSRAPNEDFQIVIASDDFDRRIEINKPYSLFERGKEKWVRIPLDPVEVSGAFQVAVFFNPTRTKGVYVGIDGDANPSHSATITADAPETPSVVEGDWMIQAYLSDDTAGDARKLLSQSDRQTARQEDEAARDAKVLGAARSLTLKHDAGATAEKMNIQGALYTVRFDTPKNVEAYVWQVKLYASQFGGQHDSEAVSGDVYILDQDRRIISRTTFPYSVATQQEAWIEIPTLPTRVQGRFYVSVDAHGGKRKGLYLHYKDEAGQELATTDARAGDRIEPAEWSQKFSNMQWLIRVKVADRPVAY